MYKLAVILTGILVLTGCEAISNLLPKVTIPEGAITADLVVHAGGKNYTYTCQVDKATNALINCTEVK